MNSILISYDCPNARNTDLCLIIQLIWYFFNADDEAPTLDCPDVTSNTDVGLDSSSSVVFNTTATDNVDANPSVTCFPTSDSVFEVGDTTVNCTSTDIAGNVGNCSFIVTIIGNDRTLNKSSTVRFNVIHGI